MNKKVQVFSGHLQTYHTHEGTFALQENCICVYSQNLYMK